MDRAQKPIDAGTGQVAASFDATTAAWLSIGTPHPSHGFVELTALPPFDEGRRGEAAATRQHRLAMTDGSHVFLSVKIDGARPQLTANVTDPFLASWSGLGAHVTVTAENGRSLRQAWHILRHSAALPRVQIDLQGSLDRPALAEITELDPPVPTGAKTRWLIHHDLVAADAPSLPARAEVTIAGAHVRWRRRKPGIVGEVEWPREARTLDLDIDIGFSTAAAWTPEAPELGRNTGDRLTDRALAYVRGCTALRVTEQERAFLTDHRILPLSWTRDAYWQALALLAADEPGDRDRVADHLRWLWRRCERPDARWVRSHHAHGRRKDLAFQADQQLYPMVELADYWRLVGALPAGVDWDVAVERAWSAAMEAVDPRTNMIASAENAADDPAAAPYIGASQILLWYAGLRLAELSRAGVLTVDAVTITTAAEQARSAFVTQLTHDGAPWAHAVDGRGLRVEYHDANDLPVALAPIWGFCAADDPGWRATMAFAFGPANPGWVDGRRPGLGSAHTPGCWTLGDVQAWVRARTGGDMRAMRAAMARLEETAFTDGMLPEAYDPNDGTPVRHWFAWPGAALAALRMLDRNGRLEDRLSAGPSR